MPRRARVIVPNMPHHIVQRGHNRNVVFVEDRDYQYYLDNLIEWKAELGLRVYAYCLMTNHVHLIVQAGDEPQAISQLMKRLAGRQTRFANKLERRTGSLWESRFKISPIETDAYLLQCCRYVELNPVKAGVCARPEEYAWSSYTRKIGLVRNTWLDYDVCFLGLAVSVKDRIKTYKSFVVAYQEAASEAKFIAAAVARNQLTGSGRFVEEVENRIGLRVEYRGQGRPNLKK
jgi:putative transposase